MNKYTEQFSITRGLELQKDYLTAWQTVLNDATFAKLQRECIDQNSKLVTGTHSGYDVFRGDDLVQFVLNQVNLPE